MADNPPGRWLTLTEAAAHFGRSERTLRRWIDKGQLTAQTESGRVLVLVYDTKADKGGQDDTPGAVSAELAELRAEVRRLSDLLSRSDEERDYLRQALAAALSKIPQIEASSSLPGASDPESKTGRAWWKFWG